MEVFSVEPFNGYLYLGLRQDRVGYSVVKTTATGEPPYEFETVVPPGAYATHPSSAVISLVEYDGRLYAGSGSVTGDAPTELIRINPDDTWELVAGEERFTPDGRHLKPLSGLGAGYDWSLNQLTWRMGVHGNALYIGTMDLSTMYKNHPVLGDLLRPHMGFDLGVSVDGRNISFITRNSFDNDLFDLGVRGFVSTPCGLFVGVADDFYGLEIWQRPNRRC
jgi:hypothetical protein